MKYPYRVPPFDSQRDAARMIYKQKRVGLFWAMGEGKTKAALDFLGVMFFNKKITNALVICKLRGIPTWEDEIESNMLPEITYCVLRPGPMSPTWQKSKIILINYEFARSCVKTLVKLAPDVIIVDEGHRIKNPQARQSKMAHKLGKVCKYAIDLTGTPIGNHPLDIWSQFKFLKPGLLEDKFKDFKQRYTISGGFGGYQIKKYVRLKELGKIIKPFTMIRKKSLTVKKRFIEVPIDMPESAKKHYREMEEDFVTYMESQEAVSAPIVLAKMTKLSQISGGFLRSTETETDFPIHTAKLEALKELTDSLREQDEKRVVIFARFLWELAEIKKLLAPEWVTYTIKGGVTTKEQKLAETLFKSSGGAMLCQIQSGSESMNLQSANYVIFYSCDYSSINFQQAQDRVHRRGQTKQCCYYYVLMCRGTIDRKVYRILNKKRDVAEEFKTLVEEIKADVKHGRKNRAVR